MQSVRSTKPNSRIRQAGALLAACALTALTGCSTLGSTITPTSTQTSLSVSTTNVNIGTNLTFSSSLSGGSSTYKPVGAIQFLDGTNEFAVESLQNGYTVTTSYNGFAAGAHSVTAYYYGDPYNAASTSPAMTVNVYQPTSTTLSVSPTTPVAQGSAVQLTAIVAAGGSAPTGAVNFNSGSTSLGSATPMLTTINGKQVYAAMLTTTSLPIGVDPVVATYPANGFQLGSVSSPAVALVHGALIPTTVTLASSPATTFPLGNVVTLTATVMPNTSSAFTLDGSVSFYDGTTLLGTSSITNGLSATLTTKQFVKGSNSGDRGVCRRCVSMQAPPPRPSSYR